jgi:hypothetical protein
MIFRKPKKITLFPTFVTEVARLAFFFNFLPNQEILRSREYD